MTDRRFAREALASVPGTFLPLPGTEPCAARPERNPQAVLPAVETPAARAAQHSS